MSDYYVSENDPATAKSIAEKFGFCLVRGVFSPDEMAGLERGLAAEHAAFNGKIPDLYSMPSLQWLLADERVHGFARALLGDKLVYYRETNAPYEAVPGPNTENPYTEYHCDARGTPADLVAPDQETVGKVYPAYRFGIYFRNYRDYSGGLKVAPGSHLRLYGNDRKLAVPGNIGTMPGARQVFGGFAMQVPVPPVELYNVPSLPGDIVIFSLRLFHAGGARRLKDRPTFASLPLIEEQMHRVAPHLFEPVSPGPRNAIFFDFGAPTQEVDFYAKWRGLLLNTDLDAGYDFHRAPPPGVTMREDRIIVALALRFTAALDAAPGAEPSAAARKDAADLAALCAAHVEFSSHHPLFDRAAYTQALAEGPFAAALAAARSILAHRERIVADSAKARGK